MPAPVARSTSATVWSRCRSTKWLLPVRRPRRRERGHQPQRPDRARSSAAPAAGHLRRPAPKPARAAASPPAAAPSCRPPARSRVPLPAPAVCWSCHRSGRARRPQGPRSSGTGPGAGCAGAPPGSSRRRRPAGQRRSSPVSPASGPAVVHGAHGDGADPSAVGPLPSVSTTAAPVITATPAVADRSAASADDLGAGVHDGGDLDARGGRSATSL